jgi:hypothetical protein
MGKPWLAGKLEVEAPTGAANATQCACSSLITAPALQHFRFCCRRPSQKAKGIHRSISIASLFGKHVHIQLHLCQNRTGPQERPSLPSLTVAPPERHLAYLALLVGVVPVRGRSVVKLTKPEVLDLTDEEHAALTVLVGWVDSPTIATCWRRRLDAPLLRRDETR